MEQRDSSVAVRRTARGLTRNTPRSFPVCARCRGGLFPNKDHYGAYLSCLSCGHVIEGDGFGLDFLLLTRGVVR